MKQLFASLLIFLFSVGLQAQSSNVITKNTLGAEVTFSTEASYEWAWDSVNKCLRSTNNNVDGTTSQTSISINCPVSGYLSFVYEVSSEENYDKLTISLDGSIIVDAISGQQSGTYSSFLDSGFHDLVLTYQKDGSASSYEDRGCIAELELTQGFESIVRYTTSDGNIVNLDAAAFNVQIVSNTYENGQGVIVFDGMLTSIGDYAFPYPSNLSGITIPSSVTNIDSRAFWECHQLETLAVEAGNRKYDSRDECNAIIETASNKLVVACGKSLIPNSVITIGAYSFGEHYKITLPGSITTIEEHAVFSWGELDITIYAKIPPSLSENSISSYDKCTVHVLPGSKEAYEFAEYWKDFTIVEDAPIWFHVDGIYYHVLSDQEKSVEVTNDRVERLDDYSGTSCYRGYVSIPNSITYDDIVYTVTSIGSDAFYKCEELRSVILPNSLKSIEKYAFEGCKKLSNISIPNGVVSLGCEAFCDCDELTRITIPASVTSIHQQGVFANCMNLAEIMVDPENSVYDSRENCNCIIETATNTVITGCYRSKIPQSIHTLGRNSFAVCERLTHVVVPKNVKNIEFQAFWHCDNLEVVEMEEGVEIIGWSVFGSNESLKIITIPSSITSIETNCFSGCTSLSDVYVNWTSPLSVSDFIYMPKDMVTLHVPFGTKALYKAADVWKNFGTIVEETPEIYAIADGEAYNLEDESMIETLIYTRSFNNTNWQALYVPFAIPVSELTAKGIVVAKLNDTHQADTNGDGKPDETRIEYFTFSDGSTKPNHPYLIKASTPCNLTLELKSVTLHPSESASIDCSTTEQLFTFQGTYETISGPVMKYYNYYAMKDNSLMRSSGTASLKPQRWYMKIESRTEEPVTYFAPSIRFSIDGIEEEVTRLDFIVTESMDDAIYTLDGRKANGQSLKPGMYIKSGKKLIVH